MRTLPALMLCALCCALSTPAAARIIVKCMGAGDEIATFRHSCPPGTTAVEEIKLVGVDGPRVPTMDAAASANPIVLYTVPDCDACDLVRQSFRGRDIPFTEIDVQDDAASQEEFRARTGSLTVPGIVIGERVLSGYSRDAIDTALLDAGYPIEDTRSKQTSPPPPARPDAPPTESADGAASEDDADSNSDDTRRPADVYDPDAGTGVD